MLTAVPSCKEDDDDYEYSDFMSGEMTVGEVSTYLAPGTTLTLTPSGLTDPTEVGYYWYNTWNSQKDTTLYEGGTGDGTYTIIIPQETGEYTITGVAYATGYYTSSVKVTFTVIDNSLEGSLKGTEIAKSSTIFTDPRDGNQYFTSAEGPTLWMKQNLYWAGSGISYEKSEVMDKIFGRYYTWEEAKDACPEGWRLPTDEDFKTLLSSVADAESLTLHETFKNAGSSMMVNATFLDERLWTYWPEINLDNSSRFCGLPVGYAIQIGTACRYTGFETYASFWTADECGEGSDTAFYRYLYVRSNDLYIGQGDKSSFRASVRCVRDR